MANTKAELIQQLLEIAQGFDTHGSDKGDGIRALITDINAGKRDHTSVKIKARINIAKFDGEKIEGDNKEPVETTEFLTEV